MAHLTSESRKEISSLSEKELQVKEKELRDSLLQLRLQWRTGQLGNIASMKLARKKMARVKTFLNRKLKERLSKPKETKEGK